MEKMCFLASFVPRKKLREAIDKIFQSFNVIGNRIFALTSDEQSGVYILTYNVASTGGVKYNDIVYNTIPLHRKKKTNTLYTLNALNEVVKMENGKLDPAFQISWESYSNCILVYKDGNLRIIPTKLYRIFYDDDNR